MEDDLLFHNRKDEANPNLRSVIESLYLHFNRFFKSYFQENFEINSINNFFVYIKDCYFNDKNKLDGFNKISSLLNIDTTSYNLELMKKNLAPAAINLVQKDLHQLGMGDMDPKQANLLTLTFLSDIFTDAIVNLEMLRLNSKLFNFEMNINSTQWDLFKWKLFEEGETLKRTLNYPEETVIAYTISNKLEWLSNLSLEEVLNIRRNNNFESIRQLFRKTRKKLMNVTIDNLDEVSNEVKISIEDELSNFPIEVLELERKQSSQKKKSLIKFSGTLSIALAGLIPFFNIASSVKTILGGDTGLLEMHDEEKNAKKEINSLKHSPIGILTEVYNKSKGSDKKKKNN
jgi:energy-converting hydrogenase A subunit M